MGLDPAGLQGQSRDAVIKGAHTKDGRNRDRNIHSQPAARISQSLFEVVDIGFNYALTPLVKQSM
jgi:hypothetical protein